MVKPQRIQLKRTKGWRIPPLTVKVTRGPGMKFGNPFTVKQLRDLGYKGTDTELAEMCVKAFRLWITGDREYADLAIKRDIAVEALPSLRGRNLACWCKPGAPCHADILLELANK